MCSISKNKKVQKGKENLQNLNKVLNILWLYSFYLLSQSNLVVFSFIYYRLGIIVPIFCGQLAEPGDSNSLIAAPPPPPPTLKVRKSLSTLIMKWNCWQEQKSTLIFPSFFFIWYFCKTFSCLPKSTLDWHFYSSKNLKTKKTICCPEARGMLRKMSLSNYRPFTKKIFVVIL